MPFTTWVEMVDADEVDEEPGGDGGHGGDDEAEDGGEQAEQGVGGGQGQEEGQEGGEGRGKHRHQQGTAVGIVVSIGPTIRIGREIQCLPYAGFFLRRHNFTLETLRRKMAQNL